MEAKFINDILNEKFSEVGDPIKDMGIGSFPSLKRGDIIECTKFTQMSQYGETIYNTIRSTHIANVFKCGEKYRLLNDAEIMNNGKIKIRTINIKSGNGWDIIIATPKQLANRFKIIK
jgi:hypothetical protein